jgi:hypothetical protein
MRRCTNLHLDKQGIASTRRGSSKFNTNPVDDTDPSLMMEQNGDRYLFSGKNIYKDEVNLDEQKILRKKIAFFETDETWTGTGGSADTTNYKTDEWQGVSSQGRKITVAATPSSSYPTIELLRIWVATTFGGSSGPKPLSDDYYEFTLNLDEIGDKQWVEHRIKKSDFTKYGSADWGTIVGAVFSLQTDSGTERVYYEAALDLTKFSNGNISVDDDVIVFWTNNIENIATQTSVTVDYMYLFGQPRQSDYDWSAVKYNAFNSIVQSIFCTNSKDRLRIDNSTIHEWGMDVPDSSPAIAVGRQTGLSGEYNAAITYTRKEGDTIVSETNLSDPASSAVTLSNQSLKITVYPPVDPQIASTRLYRTDNAGAKYYLLDEFPFPSSDKEFAYIHSWELDDGYISDKGFKFVTDVLDPDNINMINCDILANADGVWSVVSGPATLSLETANIKEGAGAVKMTVNNYAEPPPPPPDEPGPGGGE